MSHTVLVVEPSLADRDALSLLLRRANFQVLAAVSAKEALSIAASKDVDLVLLALVLPDGNGIDLIGPLRGQTGAPVIVVTRLCSESDRVVGLDAGADDYVAKPFSGRELLARMNTQLRARSHRQPVGLLVFADLVIDTNARTVTVRGTEMPFPRREFDLLAVLAAAEGRVISRTELLERIWGVASEWPAQSAVTEHVRRIRAALGEDAHHPHWIRTVHQLGYRFVGAAASSP